MTYYCTIETNDGFIALVGRDGKLTHSCLPKKTLEEALDAVKAGLQAGSVEDVAAFGDLPDKLKAYFEGVEVDFSDVPLELDGRGPFHTAALLAAQRIPYGAVVTYKELARSAGSAAAARAAGTAMANNTTPIVVPCHRVLASGGIGGFALGLEWKRTLLRLEGVEI